LGTNTNNVAEYQGLIHGLQYISQWLQHNPITPRLIIHGDSQLVIRQMLGTYQIKQPALQQLHTTAEQLMTHLREQHLVTEMELIHIVRKHNAIADHLASTAAFSGHGEVVDTVG
jgi:ribonuclease HI